MRIFFQGYFGFGEELTSFLRTSMYLFKKTQEYIPSYTHFFDAQINVQDHQVIFSYLLFLASLFPVHLLFFLSMMFHLILILYQWHFLQGYPSSSHHYNRSLLGKWLIDTPVPTLPNNHPLSIGWTTIFYLTHQLLN